MSENIQKQTTDCYQDYFEKKADDRNDLLSNREVLFQLMAFEKSVIRALGRLGLKRGKTRILDIGCGNGVGTSLFLRLGFKPENIRGIDIMEERVAEAKEFFPSINFACGDATQTGLPDSYFDLVSESVMFLQITDETLAAGIAEEMLRVAKPGAYLLLADWRYGKPGNDKFRAMSASRINSLFKVGSETEFICRTKGTLVPPIGRFLSKYMSALYFPVQAAFPFLAGQVTTVLKKVKA